MRRIADFFDWLFDCRTSELMPIMFILGVVCLVTFVSAIAFTFSPFFGVGFILSVLFGVPILIYLSGKSRKEKDE